MLRTLYRAAAAWTAVGLASGLFYREFTKHNGVPGGTQLAVVHTHVLTLGTLGLLLLLALDAALRLSGRRLFTSTVVVYNIGLAITTGGMLVKGVLQVLGSPDAASKMLAGISGLGHMTLTAAFVLLFLSMRPAVREVAAKEIA